MARHPADDLKLLRVFLALYRLQSVSRTAEQLGLTQPAVSMALARLRRHYDDPLFVRVGQGMQPTTRAAEVARLVEQALGLLEQAGRDAAGFDPATAVRSFNLAMGDVGKLIALPQLVSAIARGAPGVTLHIHTIGPTTPEDLEAGRVDLAFGSMTQRKSGMYRQMLFQDRFVCLRATGSRPLKLTRAAYERAGHVAVASSGTSAPLLAQLLAQRGLARQVRVVMPSYFGLAELVARTGWIATLPEKMALALRHSHALRVDPLPVDSGGFVYGVGQHWHARMQHDAGHRWLRQLVQQLFNQPGPGAEAD